MEEQDAQRNSSSAFEFVVFGRVHVAQWEGIIFNNILELTIAQQAATLRRSHIDIVTRAVSQKNGEVDKGRSLLFTIIDNMEIVMLPRVSQEELLHKLTDLGIEYDNVEHPEVFTVEQALPHVAHLEGTFAKNLFLKDKKKQLYLFCAPHDCDVKLNDLSKLVKASGGLRFADESILFEKLGLTQGSVTVFGLLNDTGHNVKLVLDDRLTTNTKIYFHPMVNTASIGITPQGLMTFLKSTGHEPLKVNLTKQN